MARGGDGTGLRRPSAVPPSMIPSGCGEGCADRRRSLKHDFCTDCAQPKDLLASVSSTQVLIR